jgi:hypothetical protein
MQENIRKDYEFVAKKQLYKTPTYSGPGIAAKSLDKTRESSP